MKHITNKGNLSMVGSLKFLWLLLLPPLFSLGICIYSYYKNNKYNIPVVYFVFLLTLIYVYLSPLYDVISTINNVYFVPPTFETIFVAKMSEIIVYFTTTLLSVQCLNVYHGIFFLTLCLVLLSIRDSSGLSSYSLCVGLCCIALVSLISLSFSTLSASICCYAMSKRRGYISTFLLVLLAFIVHKSSALIILPSILLYFIMQKKGKGFYFVSFICMTVCIYTLFHGLDFLVSLISMSGAESSGFYIDKAEEYAGNGFWGSGHSRVMAFSETFCVFFQYALQVCVLILSYKYFNKINNRLLLMFFLVNLSFVFGTTGLYVLSERFSISATIVSAVLLLYISKEVFGFKRMLYYKICFMFLVFYSMSIYNASALLYKKPLINNVYVANSITNKIFYMPSFMLLNIEDNGFNDKIVLKNNL